MIPSNGLQALLAILGKAQIHHETLQWVGIDVGDFHRKLERNAGSKYRNIKRVVQQLFYLTQEFYHDTTR